MDINELITIVKNKLLNQINIESINIEDKSFLHKNHKGNHDFLYDFYEEKIYLQYLYFQYLFDLIIYFLQL